MFYKIMCPGICHVKYNINTEAYLKYPSLKYFKTITRIKVPEIKT